MNESKDEYYNKVDEWWRKTRKAAIVRTNIRHPVMAYLRGKADDKFRELFKENKPPSYFDDENVKISSNYIFYWRFTFKIFVSFKSKI